MNQLWNGSGWTILNSSYGTTYMNLGSAVSSPDIDFGTGGANTAGTTKMIIKNNGNVGIGESSPSQKLHVRGDEGQPATSGTTQNGIFRVDPASTEGWGEALDMGMHIGVSGPATYAWLQATNKGNHAINYNLSLNPNGGNVGIGTTSPGYKLDVNGNTNITGTLTATVKSFIIDHPTKEGKKLQYGVLEGPEHSVYVRGKLTNNNTITLPDHWTGLVHEDTITVNLTPIGKRQDLWVETVTDTTITVGSENEINCFYTVFAERKDIEKLITEFDK
jgi:hypothetical protein